MTIDTVPNDWPRYARKLRLASGEGGKVDVAARFEKRRNRSFVYIQSPNSGLIELDESPPLSHDEDALEVADGFCHASSETSRRFTNDAQNGR